jgi:predicted membrane protein DUF2157
VVAAVARLKARNILTAEQAAFFDRAARRRLVSVWLEIRTVLYVGVLLLMSGVGLLVSEHHRDIGPWIIAGGIAVAAVGCLVWVTRKAPPFSWEALPSPNAAFDYVLLLGLLLFASDLAYIEAEFTILGRHWPHHLLVVAAVYLLAAYRWDSRTILGLALTTLAAWRGISVGLISGSLWRGDDADLRLNAITLGALYLVTAWHSVRMKRKAHFEEVFANAGLLLLLGALVSGVLDRGSAWGAWLVALLVVAGAVMWLSFRLGRSLYFVQGVAAAYVGLLRLLFAPFRGEPGAPSLLLAALLGVAALALVFAAHRRISER